MTWRVTAAGDNGRTFSRDFTTEQAARLWEIGLTMNGLVASRPIEVGSTLHHTIARAREAWEHAGRPGDYPQLRLVDALGEQADQGRRVCEDRAPVRTHGEHPPLASVSACSPSCVVCDDHGCEHCPKATA